MIHELIYTTKENEVLLDKRKADHNLSNVLYDEILDVNMPAGIMLIRFTDDINIMATVRYKEILMENANTVL